jgi:hypothetical protein|tara:strand:+ start:82 stop:666 length:585 start_codon:yes stop_codon:yes gene_type:complete
MPISLNGSGTISGISTGGISDTKAVAIAAQPVGSIIQVQNTTVTDISTVSCNSSFEDTSITCSITPSSSSSKILINLTVTGEGNAADQRRFTHRIKKVISGGATSYIRGATVSNRVSLLGSTGDLTNDASTSASSFSVTNLMDAPSTTSAVTYTLQITYQSGTGGGTYYINRNVSEGSGSPRFLSWITLMEVAA